MKGWAIACFAFAALGFMVAAQNIAKEPRGDGDLSAFVGHAVGNLLIPFAALIVGLVLWNKAAERGRAIDAEIVDDQPKVPPA